MKKHALELAAALVLVFASAIVTWSSVSAYVTCCYWSSNSVSYTYNYTVPSGFYSGINYGADVWTAVSGTTFTFWNSSNSDHVINYPYVDGPGGTLAVTTIVYTVPGYVLTDMDMSIDYSEDWYTGSGTPGGSQIDLRSAMAHEFGHAAGLYHADSGACVGGAGAATAATMCNGQVPGSINKRTLESDDANGLNALYD